MIDEIDYSIWTLEQLTEENNRLWRIREEVKAEQMKLAPFLDAAWKRFEDEERAKADPALTQNVGT